MRFAMLIALSLTAVLTAGCATAIGPPPNECAWAEPIRPSRKDVLTDRTLEQIVAHNELGERLCGWRP